MDEVMNLRQMEAFKTLMLAGSVTAAAELLKLGQPTVSKLIAQLERQTKLRLFERTRGRLVPTREAYSLLKNVEKALNALEEVGRSAVQLARIHTGAVRIACIPSIGTGFMPKAVASFLKAHPQTKATLYVRSSNYVVERVGGKLADIGLVADGVDAIGAESVCFQEVPGAVCVLPPSHPLRAKKILQPKDFEGEAFITVGRGKPFRELIDSAFVDAGVNRNLVVEASHFAAAYALAAEGAGVTIVDPYTAISCFRKDEAILRPFHPEVKFLVYLLKPAHVPVPAIVEDFVAHLVNERKQMTKVLAELMTHGL
jgi:DNA-binding transcriptional LysR family regulator